MDFFVVRKIALETYDSHSHYYRCVGGGVGSAGGVFGVSVFGDSAFIGSAVFSGADGLMPAGTACVGFGAVLAAWAGFFSSSIC